MSHRHSGCFMIARLFNFHSISATAAGFRQVGGATSKSLSAPCATKSRRRHLRCAPPKVPLTFSLLAMRGVSMTNWVHHVTLSDWSSQSLSSCLRPPMRQCRHAKNRDSRWSIFRHQTIAWPKRTRGCPVPVLPPPAWKHGATPCPAHQIGGVGTLGASGTSAGVQVALLVVSFHTTQPSDFKASNSVRISVAPTSPSRQCWDISPGCALHISSANGVPHSQPPRQDCAHPSGNTGH